MLQAIPGGDRFSDVKLLTIVRVSIIPVTLIACIVASTYNETGCESNNHVLRLFFCPPVSVLGLDIAVKPLILKRGG